MFNDHPHAFFTTVKLSKANNLGLSFPTLIRSRPNTSYSGKESSESFGVTRTKLLRGILERKDLPFARPRNQRKSLFLSLDQLSSFVLFFYRLQNACALRKNGKKGLLSPFFGSSHSRVVHDVQYIRRSSRHGHSKQMTLADKEKENLIFCEI